METPTNITHLSEEIMTEILARLPLKSISTCKSVCKTWKSTLESSYFRRLFVSRHENSSSSWSILSWYGLKELIGFHGCETWDLQKSLASSIPPFHLYKFSHHSSSSGLVLIWQVYATNICFVGNPVLQQWVQIPPPPGRALWCGFVTRVDEDGVVLSFKVVMLAGLRVSSDYVSETIIVSLYSSETGVWTSKEIHCPYQLANLCYMTLNGTIYFYYISQFGVFVAHDFYSESDQFRVLHYPDHPSYNDSDTKRSLTTSGGFVMYITTLAQEEQTVFKVWRLNNDDSWQLLWNLGIPSIGNCVPMAMHPFDSGIVYLWSRQNHHLVSCNLPTRSYRTLGDGYTYNVDHYDCVIDQPSCDEHMDENEPWGPRSIEVLFQFVFPRWMESMPCPPQIEMIDTASLLSYLQKTRKRDRGNDD